MEFDIYGFGVSRVNGQYKVVRVFIAQKSRSFAKCQVYTVGSGCKWRSITSPGFLRCSDSALGAFLKGNMHCLGHYSNDSPQRIYCIDLETEVFTTLSPPPTPCFYGNGNAIRSLSFLGDCVCACDNSLCDYETYIWLMKEYGDEKSWTKQIVINKASTNGLFASPIKVFENGDILMEECFSWNLLYYFSKTATIRAARDVFGLDSCINYKSARIYTPTFLSLKIFAEDVFSFCLVLD